MVTIALLGYTKSNINKFLSLLPNTMISPFLIKAIAIGSSQYVISLSRSCPRKMRFESQTGANATICSLMVLLLASRKDIVLISSMQITCPTTVIKSILLALLVIKRVRLLHRYCDTHKSRSQILELKSNWSCYFLTINTVMTGPKMNRFRLELS